MPKRSPAIHLEEFPGDHYADLQAAHRSALSATAHDLASTVQALLTSGRLVKRGNQIIPNPSR